MTEKDYNPKQKEIKAMKKQQKKQEQKPVETPIKRKEEPKKEIEEKETGQETEPPTSSKQSDDSSTKEKAQEDKKPKKPIKKIKKEEVVVNGRSVPVSKKYAVSICRFIKGKRIGDAIRDLEQVAVLKKSVPMKGEYAHKKGPGKIASGSGKYPVRAAKHFIILLKSLAGNANNHEIDEPVISEAVANFAARPFGKFGRVKRKRTHIIIKAREKKSKEMKQRHN